MGYFNQLIKKSGLLAKDRKTAPVRPRVQDIAVHQEVESPVSAHEPAMSTTPPADHGSEPVQLSPSPSPVINEQINEALTGQERENIVSRPKAEVKHDLPGQQDDITASSEKQVWSEPEVKTVEARDSVNDEPAVMHQPDKKIGPVQPVEERVDEVLPDGNRIKAYEQSVTVDDVKPTLQQPAAVEHKTVNNETINNEIINIEDKTMVANYAFEQVSQWIQGGDEKPGAPLKGNETHHERETVVQAESPAERPSRQQTVHHHHVEKQLIRPLDQDVHLSIGKINVIVEAPKQTAVTQTPQEVRPPRQEKQASSFLNWQRHYFNG